MGLVPKAGSGCSRPPGLPSSIESTSFHLLAEFVSNQPSRYFICPARLVGKELARVQLFYHYAINPLLEQQVDARHEFTRLKQTKNGKAWALPFNETLWSLFSRLRTRQDITWVFHDAAGHRWNGIRHPFDGTCEGTGLIDFHFPTSAIPSPPGSRCTLSP